MEPTFTPEQTPPVEPTLAVTPDQGSQPVEGANPPVEQAAEEPKVQVPENTEANKGMIASLMNRIRNL